MLVPKFMELLREALLTHDWKTVLDIVNCLVSESTFQSAKVIWKAGFAGLQQTGEEGSRFMEQFAIQLCALKELSAVDVLLDYLMYLLQHLKLEEAKQLERLLARYEKYSKNKDSPSHKESLALFQGYQGLVYYVEWKSIIKEQEKQSEADLFDSPDEQTSRTIADKAMAYMEGVLVQPGVWDIFIDKLVEMYEYYDRIEDAKAVLVKYRYMNPENPNAHLYLYKLACRHGDTNKSEYLQSLVGLDPAHPLALELFTLQNTESNGNISLLFDYLDFPHCSSDLNVWTTLHEHLQDIHSSSRGDSISQVRQCWQTRKSWWPHAVLTRDSTADNLSLSELDSKKRLVYELLTSMDKD